jgi:hypothetical protein
MIWRLFVLCKNQQCGIPRKQILLPFSAPVESDAILPAPPQDMFPARIVCHDCEQWAVYTAEDQEWLKIKEPQRFNGGSGPRCWTIKIKCGQPKCASTTRWHIQDDSGLEAREVARLVMHAKPEIVCERGHSLRTAEAKVAVVSHE